MPSSTDLYTSYVLHREQAPRKFKVELALWQALGAVWARHLISILLKGSIQLRWVMCALCIDTGGVEAWDVNGNGTFLSKEKNNGVINTVLNTPYTISYSHSHPANQLDMQLAQIKQ
eukprot:scaffold447125_cov37-Prasinocladus_malaysianus.AAC.1